MWLPAKPGGIADAPTIRATNIPPTVTASPRPKIRGARPFVTDTLILVDPLVVIVSLPSYTFRSRRNTSLRPYHRDDRSADQKTNLNPSCTCRDGVMVFVIRPADATGVPFPVKIVVELGTEKLFRLKMLNASRRNSKFRPRATLNFFTSPQSLVNRPGPRSTRDGTLPRKPGGAATKHFGLNHWSGAPTIALFASHPGAQLGRSGPAPRSPWRELWK